MQEDCDVEWKFARTKLWLNYIYDGSTLPVPFNMLPTPKSICYAYRWLKELCCCNDHGENRHLEGGGKRQLFIKVGGLDGWSFRACRINSKQNAECARNLVLCRIGTDNVFHDGIHLIPRLRCVVVEVRMGIVVYCCWSRQLEISGSSPDSTNKSNVSILDVTKIMYDSLL